MIRAFARLGLALTLVGPPLSAMVGLSLLLEDSAEAGKRPTLPPDLASALAHASEDRDATIRRLEAAITSATPEQRVYYTALLSEQLRLAGRGAEARVRLDELAGAAGDIGHMAVLGQALVDAEQAPDDAAHALLSVKEAAVLDSQNAERFTLLAERAARMGSDGDIATHARKATTYAQKDADQLFRVQTRLAAIGYGSAPRAATPKPVAAAPTTATPEQQLSEAESRLSSGDTERVRALATALAANPDAGVRDRARMLLQTVDGPPADPMKIGVLLPLTGKYASVAEQVKVAFEDGWSQVAPLDSLVFGDTNGTADGALAAMHTLVDESHVIALVGPLLSDETAPVVDAADTLGVPLITLSQAWEGDTAHPWVFQGWLTPGQQIDALLDVTMGERNMHDFAIYAPTSSYGDRAADLFKEKVEQRGGRIVVRVDYPEDTKTHSAFAPGLRQPDPTPGVHNRWYDAIFVPDNANRVVLAAAAMAYAEISIGAFRAQDREAVPLLGLSAWNRQEIITNGAANVRGGLFTDVYVAPPTGVLLWYPLAPWQEFTTRFHDATGRNPSAIEALASDAGRVVASALRLAPKDRYDFRTALLSVRPNSTISEVVGFDPTLRVLKRKIAVLSVTPDGLRPLGYE